jgi:uncharacterized membrane protein
MRDDIFAGGSVPARPLSTHERAPLWRLRLTGREAISRSLVLVPALYLAAAVALGIVLPAIDRARGGGGLLGIEGSAVQSILEAIASGMIAFSGLVVSVAVLVVQFGAGQYSPRLVQIFRRDPVIKHALGLFVAPGVFTLVAVADVGGHRQESPATLTVVVALVLMVAALGALFRFIGRLLDLMRPRRIYARLLEQVRPAMADVYPYLLDQEVDLRPAPSGAVRERLLHERREAVLAGVDRARLVGAAQRDDAVIEVAAQVGTYVGHGSPILLVRGGESIPRDELGRALVFADGRGLAQDPAFAIRCVVDVAIRALSAAINDPTSAVEGIDALGALLGRLGVRRLESSAVLDDDGAVRLILPTPGWDELVDLALTEVRCYGAATPQIARRLAALLDDLQQSLPASRRPTIDRHRRLLAADVERLYANPTERAFASIPDRLGIGGRGQSLARADGAPSPAADPRPPTASHAAPADASRADGEPGATRGAEAQADELGALVLGEEGGAE